MNNTTKIRIMSYASQPDKNYNYDGDYVEFEGKMFPTVGDTDSYLKKLYGDYMTPPPEKEKISHHDSVF